MNDILFWGGLAIMLGSMLLGGRSTTGRWIYCGGLAIVIVGTATDSSVSTAGRWMSSVTLAIVLGIYIAASSRMQYLRERDHAREEVHEGQVDGVRPEEAQGREDV